MWFKRLHPWVWLIGSVLYLSGCTNLDPAPSNSDQKSAWTQHLNWVSGLQHWQASGRVAVRSAVDGGSATLHWRQAPEEFTLRLHGPFGQGSVLIEGHSESVSLRRANGQVTRAGSAEALLSQELGWSVPVSVMRYWILGRPAPDYPVSELQINASGLLGRMNQAGWQVVYKGYRDAGEGSLPAKFELRREALLVRVVLSEWQLSQ